MGIDKETVDKLKQYIDEAAADDRYFEWPGWEPYEKVADDQKSKMGLMLRMMGELNPIDLGLARLTWSRVPERSFELLELAIATDDEYFEFYGKPRGMFTKHFSVEQIQELLKENKEFKEEVFELLEHEEEKKTIKIDDDTEIEFQYIEDGIEGTYERNAYVIFALDGHLFKRVGMYDSWGGTDWDRTDSVYPVTVKIRKEWCWE